MTNRQREARRHLPPTESSTHTQGEQNDRKQLTKQEFGRRLQRALLDRGWNQSELARRANLRRDAISTYVRGRSFPEPVSLERLARALGMQPGELLPNAEIQAISQDERPAFQMRQSQGYPDKVWLQVNQVVTAEQALRIHKILSEHQPDPSQPDPSRPEPA